MADTGTILVPTRFIGEALLDESATIGLPEFARRKLTETYRRGREGVAHAIDAGVTIAAGTDILTSGDMWGRNGHELALLVECGLSPIQAIEAATSNGPLTVGPQARRTGQLRAGFDADVVALDANPLDDIAVLGNADAVTHVWQHGTTVKAPSFRGHV
jgi:imidazolonepropionase-like amidohydrolase